jgi:hypothetical protein
VDKNAVTSWTNDSALLLKLISVGFGGLIVGGIFWAASHKVPFSNPHLLSQPYVWPIGCRPAQYSVHMPISRSCLTDRNLFDGTKFGFFYPRGVSHYYRVGEDAVGPGCTMNECVVQVIVKGAFTHN